jgi:hypothetical protein
MNDVKKFNNLAINIVERCMSETPFPEKISTQVSIQFKQLQEHKNEIVLATIPLFQELMTSCQNTDKQIVNN